MSKKRIFKLSLSLIMLIMFIIVGFNIKSDNEITLKKALEISNIDALKWAKDAKLVFITSTDAQDNPTEKSGNNGKRNSWNVIFSSLEKDKQYNIIVSDKKIILSEEVDMPVYDYIDSKKITLDSNDLVNIAKNNGLLANYTNSGWAIGYHFALQYLNDSDGNIFLAYTVYGNLNGNFAYVLIDPITGKLISIMEQVGYDENGKSIWEEIN